MIYAILGPTCSGKSEVAEQLSLALKLPVINFDAFQVYKELDKGTAKPPQELLDSGRYFLYSFISVLENYSVADYQKDARELLKKLNNNAILVGGTGLYLKALLYDYKFYEEEQMDENFLKDKSNDELYEELLTLDKEDALKIGPNNRKRLLRALYVYKEHGKSKTDLNNNGKNKLLYDDVIFIGINKDREKLYEMINHRVDDMYLNGLENEVNNLFSYYDPKLRAFQAIGYKEFNSNLDSNEIKELIKKNTRNYAKRQMTFFKHQFENVHWFDNIEDIKKFLNL